jgi:hypothetical protein
LLDIIWKVRYILAMKKHFTVFLLIILACVVTIYASVTISLRVQSEGDNASLTWNVNGISLTQQQRFSVLRRTPQTSYQEIASIAISDNTSYYSYTDKAIYKTSDAIYYYKIQLINANNPNYIYGSSIDQSIYLNISGVKQTWGSIKAMFR